MTMFPVNQRLSESPFHISDTFPFHINTPAIRSRYPAHRHDYLELSFVIEGSGYQLINGKKCPMMPGTCSFLLPFQVHELFADSPPLRLYNCMFAPEFLFPSWGTSGGLRDLLFTDEELPPYVQVEGDERERFGTLAQTMLTEFRSDSLWRNELIRNKLSEFLIHFDRLRRQTTAEWKSASESRSKSIWPIVHYVHTHYDDAITLNGLAEMFGINRSHLSAEFKRQLGLNFVRFLHEIRIRHACSLLACTDMSIFDIAVEVGFGSFKSFSRIFSELKRMTPGEYRKRFATDAPLS